MKKVLASFGVIAMCMALGMPMAPEASAQTITTTQTQVYSFNRNLTLGSSGADVSALQQILIASGHLKVAAPTGYFGVMTKAALAGYQAAHGIQPASGYFGPVTRTYVSVHGSGTVTTTPGSTTNPSPSTNTNSGSLKGGEASLEDLNLRDGDDDNVEESDTAEIAEIQFDVEDADIRIDRVDLSFTSDASGDEEDEPWNTFKKITLRADGKVIASEDVSDEDDWLENDDEPYVFRFNNIKYVVREGKTAKITVDVETQKGIDGSEDGIAWTVFVDDRGIRGEDGEGIQQYIGDENETVTFDVEEEGSGEELNVRRSSDDPDATTFQVEDDKKSDWYTVLAFDLEAKDNDIDLDTIPIIFQTSDDKVSDVINDVKLVIDGKTFDDFDWSNANGATASATFDIDKDFTIDKDDRVKVEMKVEFKSATAYSGGTTIQASVNGGDIEAEGADDLSAEGSITGDVHTLQVSGVNVEVKNTSDSKSASNVSGQNNDVAIFFVDIEVEAFDQDVFIPQAGSLAFTYQIEDANGNAVSAADTTGTSSTIASRSGADTEGEFYVVSEGGKETFRLQVTFDPAVNAQGMQYRLQILTLNFNDIAAAPDQSYVASSESKFETSYKLIVD